MTEHEHENKNSNPEEDERLERAQHADENRDDADDADTEGADSDVVTPREDQGDDKAVVYLEEGEERDLSGTGGEVPPTETDDGEGTADQGSLGGTITGPDPAPGTTAPANPNPAPPTNP